MYPQVMPIFWLYFTYKTCILGDFIGCTQHQSSNHRSVFTWEKRGGLSLSTWLSLAIVDSGQGVEAPISLNQVSIKRLGCRRELGAVKGVNTERDDSSGESQLQLEFLWIYWWKSCVLDWLRHWIGSVWPLGLKQDSFCRFWSTSGWQEEPSG